MNKQCTGCVVSAGTHKPAEALHQKIEEPQPEAYRLADECAESATNWLYEIDTRLKAAKMLRAQQARIAELEAQLDATGADGVEPLRSNQLSPAPSATVDLRYVLDGILTWFPTEDALLAIGWNSRDARDALKAYREARAALDANKQAAQAMEKDAARWRAATRDLEINDIAVCFFDKHGDEKIVMGDEADAAIDAALAAQAKQGEQECTSARES